MRNRISGTLVSCNKLQEIKMKKQYPFYFLIIILFLSFALLNHWAFCQDLKVDKALDEKVERFLENKRWFWRDQNVPYADGKVLYDIIVKNNYKKALEIGTSTGHSATWIAWAISKTGGKLITIEIDEGRHKEALANFEEAGLSDYIDARLANAHTLVEELEGPFDFVFSDADKDWYTNYFKAIAPKLTVGGCYVTHNVSAGWSGGRYDRRFGRGRGSRSGDYYSYVTGLSNFESSLDNSGAGMLISYKKADGNNG
jgi:caffeoyl-CoA O-methyltransferase